MKTQETSSTPHDRLPTIPHIYSHTGFDESPRIICVCDSTALTLTPTNIHTSLHYIKATLPAYLPAYLPSCLLFQFWTLNRAWPVAGRAGWEGERLLQSGCAAGVNHMNVLPKQKVSSRQVGRAGRLRRYATYSTYINGA